MTGIAFDVGTTTVVGYLCNLGEKQILGSISKTNPQIKHGPDVISRIMYCGREEGNLLKLHNLIVSCLNEIVDEFVKTHEIKRGSIEKLVAVGNTTMSHLLLNIDPASLALAPFVPGFTGSVRVPADSVGILINPDCVLHVLPNIAGHVGSDMLGVMLAAGIRDFEGTVLVIDIGTNGEIVLSHKGRLLACSTAAGPAFEGSGIKHGMRAAAGAIEAVEFSSGKLALKVIGDLEPTGICGSGLVDALAVSLDLSWLDEDGRVLVADSKGEKAIVLYNGRAGAEERAGTERGTGADEMAENEGKAGWVKSDIRITQKDIREVQFAKAAVLAGIEILMKEVGVGVEDLDKVFLSGAFGNYLRKESAIRIGLLPGLDPNIVQPVGNGAGEGAALALMSDEVRAGAASLASSVEHVELANHPDFQSIFLNAMYFR